MTNHNHFQELNLSNTYLFAAVMKNPDICKEIIELILGIPIKRIEVQTEIELSINPEYHGIRLDVYAADEEQSHYNIEMQVANKGELPQRSRYYQSFIDASTLYKGKDYKQLGKSFVIFICMFDPFGRGKYCYTYEERCLEDNQPLNDGTRKIFLNARGKNTSEVSEGLIRFLKYLENSTDQYVEETEDSFLQKIHQEVKRVKRNPGEERRYMSIQELMEDKMAEGHQLGRQEERARIMKVVQAMQEAGETENIPRLFQESEFLEAMLKKYHIE